MTNARIHRLTLTNFRSYRTAQLETGTGPVVLTGSHNMSDTAEQVNDETLVVVHDRAVAEQYYRMFREVYDHPQTLGVVAARLDEGARVEFEVTKGPKGLQATNVTAA